MFEKEAEEYTENPKSAWKQGMTCVGSVRQAFKDGADFGYNKANEWHYPSKGDFPKTEGSYYVAMDNGCGYKSGAILNWVEETDCEEDFHWEDDDYECYDEQVYAWKECPILPPKESE